MTAASTRDVMQKLLAWWTAAMLVIAFAPTRVDEVGNIEILPVEDDE